MAAKKKSPQQSKSPLNRTKVLKQAMRLADKGGIEQLSMRKLAQSLNVEAMSLYNHVKNKDDVLDGMVGLVIEQFELPKSGKDWKKELKVSANSMHAVLLQHRWAAQLLISRVITGEAMMRNADAWIGCFYKAGLSYVMADHAWNAVTNHIYGFTLTQINSPVDVVDYAKSAEQYLPLVPENDYPHMHGLMQLIIMGKHDGINDFNFGLDLILDGLERLKSEQ